MRDPALVRSSRAWACYDCGKCTASCPVARAGGVLSPRRHVLSANLGHERDEAARRTLFSCLTCSQCEVRCPAQVSYTNLVMGLRARAHGEGVEPDCPHGGALQSIMRMMGMGVDEDGRPREAREIRPDRLGWLDPSLRTVPDEGEVFLWTGCTPLYDAFFPELAAGALEGTRASVRLLNALGVVPVVSPDERCCGHDLLFNGDVAGFERLARHNVRLVEASGATVLVVPCAECLRIWRLDYARFFRGTPPLALHLSEYLQNRLSELRFEDGTEHLVTYQDPCRLGRHLGIFEAPRAVLSAVPGLRLVEMRRNGQNAVCCAGGTWSNCDRFAKKIQVERLREARSTGATTLVTACPKCRIHFRCAMQDPALGAGIGIEMRDLASVLADALA